MQKLYNGLDVSSIQKIVEWDKIKDAGYKFAMIRVGFRGYSTGLVNLDSCFVYNVTNAYRCGLKIGLYFYATSINEKEAIEEAEFILTQIKENGFENKITLPIVYDFEGYKKIKYRTYGISKEQRVKNCKAFQGVIKAHGYDCMLYGSKGNIKTTYDLNELKDYIWCAKYAGGYSTIIDDDSYFPDLGKEEYNNRIAIWQYTSIGKVDGIKGNVDLDAMYIDLIGDCMKTRSTILNKAITYLGLSENPKNSNNVIFNTDYYGKPVSGSCYSWCCTFVWDIFRMCNASKYFYGGGKCASCTSTLNYYKKNHPTWVTRDINKAQEGDLVFYQFDTDAYADHIGIFEKKLSNTTFSAIEGNTSPSDKGSQDNGGCVARKTRKMSQLMAFVHIEFDDDDNSEPTYGQDDFIAEVCAITRTKTANEALKKTVTINRKYNSLTKKWTYKNQKHPLVVPLQKMFNALGYDCGTVDGCAGTLFFNAVNNYEINELKMKKSDNEVTAKGSIWKKFLGV